MEVENVSLQFPSFYSLIYSMSSFSTRSVLKKILFANLDLKSNLTGLIQESARKHCPSIEIESRGPLCSGVYQLTITVVLCKN